MSEELSTESPLKHGEDYYIENDLWVFTESYLKKRGYCCSTGCRHCPYVDERDGPGDTEG